MNKRVCGTPVYFRLTPYEWENPHPCVDEPEELENELTLHNCFWHNWGSLMQQGSDIAPKYVITIIIDNRERDIINIDLYKDIFSL